jgi:hypothetical protein
MKTRNSLKFLSRKRNDPISISLIDEIILGNSSEEENNYGINRKHINLSETDDPKNNSDCYNNISRRGGSTTTETKKGRKKKIVLQDSPLTVNLCSSEEKEINEIRLDDRESVKARTIYSLSEDFEEKSCSDSSYKSKNFNLSQLSEDDSISSVSEVSSKSSKTCLQKVGRYKNKQTISTYIQKEYESQTDDENYLPKDESMPGDIRTDKIRRIISGTITDPISKSLSVVVEFEERSDGVKPSNKKYHDSVLRKYAPYTLIDFLKSRICTNKTYYQYAK